MITYKSHTKIGKLTDKVIFFENSSEQPVWQSKQLSEKKTDIHEILKIITERQIDLSEEDIMQRPGIFQAIMLIRNLLFYLFLRSPKPSLIIFLFYLMLKINKKLPVYSVFCRLLSNSYYAILEDSLLWPVHLLSCIDSEGQYIFIVVLLTKL